MISLFCKKETKEKLINDHNKNYENTNNLFLKIVEDGYIIPKHISCKKIISNGAFYFAEYGRVTNNKFEFIKESQIEDGRYSDTEGCLIGASYEDCYSPCEILDENVIYIGDFRQHPAHFYLETLSRLWILLDNKEYTKMKFAFIGLPKDNTCEFFDFFFEAMGIPLENVIHITKVTKCKKIIIPEASFKLNLNYHKKYLQIINKIMSNLPNCSYKKVYFAKKLERSIGEQCAIELFKQNGYQIVYPETLKMKDKLSILKNCEEFVASNGSNAHFSLFLPETSKLTVLNRSDDIHFVQTQIDILKNLNVTYVDSYCDLLPTWLSLGPFSFIYTDEFEKWLNFKNFKYNKSDLISKTKNNTILFIQNWFKTYSEKENLARIENTIHTKYIPPSKVLKILQFFLENKFRKKSKCFVRKQMKILGIKIKYKKHVPYIKPYKGLLCIDKDYINNEILNFKPKKKTIVKNMVLSMTSYPERMKDIHYAIFSILNQKIQPEKFILWLAKEEFPNGENDVPQSVLQFKKFGLEIRFTDAIRSFKKIIPALKEYPNSILVSADDDIYYPKDWLNNLYKSYKKDATKIYAQRIHKVEITNGEILPYSQWEKCVQTEEPSYLNFPTSVGGILYPPNIFSSEATNIEIFKKLCPNQDDVWVWAMAILNNKYFVNPENPMNNNLIFINPERELGISGETTLGQVNCLKGENDKQIENVSKYYKFIEKLKN